MKHENSACAVHSPRPKLAGEFEPFFQRLAAEPLGGQARTLAAFAASLLNGETLNLDQIEQLPNEADLVLCLSLFEYCLAEGLSEEERLAASAAFEPFIAMCAPGARH